MTKTKVLFVPGYFGSTLVDRKTGENRWVRVSDFFSNKYDLRMHETYSDLPTVNDVVDSEILLRVKLIPKILEIESYGKTLKHLQQFCDENNRELHTITYDWRQDFQISLQKIADKISLLTDNGEKIEVVAHSNGGILMAYFLRYGTQDFLEAKENWFGTQFISKLSIVASPLRGALSLFRHMKFGTSVLKNKKMMSSLDYTSFCSSYFFLPSKEWQKAYVDNRKEKQIELDLYNVDNWEKYNWGPYDLAHQKEIPVNKFKFSQVLKRAKKFHELMLADINSPPMTKIKLQVIKAYGKQTYFFPLFKNLNDLHQYFYPRKFKIDGDGVVASFSSEPLSWFSAHELQKIEIKAEHLKVISEYNFQKNIHSFLVI